MSSVGSREQVLRMVRGYEAAAAADREARRGKPPSDPVAGASDLLELAELLHGWPWPASDVREREVARARAVWRLLVERTHAAR